MKACPLLPKVMDTRWEEGKGAGRGEDEVAEKEGKMFHGNPWEGMVLRALAGRLTSGWMWRCFGLYELMIAHESVVKFLEIWTHNELKAHILPVWMVHYLIRRTGCASWSCYEVALWSWTNKSLLVSEP